MLITGIIHCLGKSTLYLKLDYCWIQEDEKHCRSVRAYSWPAGELHAVEKQVSPFTRSASHYRNRIRSDKWMPAGL